MPNCDHAFGTRAGDRVSYVNGGFTGTVLAFTRSGDPIIHWDTHFGSPVQDAPKELVV